MLLRGVRGGWETLGESRAEGFEVWDADKDPAQRVLVGDRLQGRLHGVRVVDVDECGRHVECCWCSSVLEGWASFWSGLV